MLRALPFVAWFALGAYLATAVGLLACSAAGDSTLGLVATVPFAAVWSAVVLVVRRSGLALAAILALAIAGTGAAAGYLLLLSGVR